MPATRTSQRRTTPYSKASVERALEHHHRAGAVLSWGPIPGTAKYIVALPVQGMGSFDRVELTLKEAWLLVLGILAGTSSTNRRGAERRIERDAQPRTTLPIATTDVERLIEVAAKWEHGQGVGDDGVSPRTREAIDRVRRIFDEEAARG